MKQTVTSLLKTHPSVHGIKQRPLTRAGATGLPPLRAPPHPHRAQYKALITGATSQFRVQYPDNCPCPLWLLSPTYAGAGPEHQRLSTNTFGIGGRVEKAVHTEMEIQLRRSLKVKRGKKLLRFPFSLTKIVTWPKFFHFSRKLGCQTHLATL